MITLDRDVQRFWGHVDKTSTCWNWTGTITGEGYGQFTAQRARWRAHRLAWMWANGPVPSGLVLDHLCRNRACVRPDHLEAVTIRENVLRGIGTSAVNARKKKCDRGHPLDDSRTCSVCRRAIDKRAIAKRKAERAAIVCNAPTKSGSRCRLRVALGKTCRLHGTPNIGTNTEDGQTNVA